MPFPIKFMDAAASKVAEMIEDEGNPALKLRVYVSGGGCSGFSYGFAFEEALKEDDFSLVKSGVTLVVDSMSMQYLTGAEIDFEDGLEGSRFVIRNPNAASTCGCGSSFSI
ncbi:MAG TPA: iron-sulfur cluster insertion protein ErpA [Rhodocyclaceae bacterium]|nr:iron-sulfur cluster insertion protein ErpA [Rhodocyclaceae bacterium]